MKFSRIFDAQVVRIPRVQIRSLTASGMPVSTWQRPSAMAASARRACSSAVSAATVM